jgi:hypothetical protein
MQLDCILHGEISAIGKPMKGGPHEILKSCFFSTHGSLIHTLKHFRKWQKIRQDISQFNVAVDTVES